MSEINLGLENLKEMSQEDITRALGDVFEDYCREAGLDIGALDLVGLDILQTWFVAGYRRGMAHGSQMAREAATKLLLRDPRKSVTCGA